jgi:hypothetical protein
MVGHEWLLNWLTIRSGGRGGAALQEFSAVRLTASAGSALSLLWPPDVIRRHACTIAASTGPLSQESTTLLTTQAGSVLENQLP